jgi:hypothetical protein
MESMESQEAGFPPFPHPLEIPAGIPTTGMVRRLFHKTGYFGWQEVHHGNFNDWHRPEQD